MQYPSYPKYKDSGVEWLGEVPEHWEVERLKYSAKYWVSNVDKVPSEDELPVRLCNYTDVYYFDLISPDMELMETTATREEIERFGLDIGDVLITKDSEDWRDIAIPARVVETSSDLVCGYHLAMVRPRHDRLDGSYLFRGFQAHAVNQQFQVAAKGVTRYGLPKSSVGEAWVPLPPLPEQHAIAAFLDAQTAKIDTLIAKKRELIDRLKEKRAALITRTVTRGLPPEAAKAAGLDPNPRMKDSGVEWLGEVPEHWEVKRLKYISPAITVGIVIEPSKYYEDYGVPCLRSFNVKPNVLIDNNLVYISKESNRALNKSMLHQGDLVVVRSGAPGTTAVVDDRFHNANCIDLIIIKKPSNDSSMFISYYLNSTAAQVQFSEGTGGAIQQHFNITTASRLLIALPPFNEQRSIAEYLDCETAKLDQMATKVETAIERLQEYRSALITAAVTGKIDVREAAQ